MAARQLGETTEWFKIDEHRPEDQDVPPRSASSRSTSWQGRRNGGTILRGLLGIAPTLAAGVVTIGLSRFMPADPGLVIGSFLLLCIGAVGFGAAAAVASMTTRLLPLAALLKLSLAFPDQAPSRFRLAMKATSSRRLKREMALAREQGLSSNTTLAAEQVVLLTAAVGEHDRKTRGHSERVRVLSRLIGEEMGLSEADLDRLQWGAMLHDIGKLTVAPQILNKAEPLTPTEWAILQHHPEAGRDLIAPLHEFLGPHAHTTDGHHERWDGTGYPRALRGEEIPLPARIVAVADAFEVMTSFRAYKKPMSAEQARAELTACAGTHFDPAVVRAMLSVSIGPLRWATGPVALAMTLPIVGEFVGLAARAGFHIGGTPAAAAAAVPATATAASLSVAAASGAMAMPSLTLTSNGPGGAATTTSVVSRVGPAVASTQSTTDDSIAGSRGDSNGTTTTESTTIPATTAPPGGPASPTEGDSVGGNGEGRPDDPGSHGRENAEDSSEGRSSNGYQNGLDESGRDATTTDEKPSKTAADQDPTATAEENSVILD